MRATITKPNYEGQLSECWALANAEYDYDCCGRITIKINKLELFDDVGNELIATEEQEQQAIDQIYEEWETK